MPLTLGEGGPVCLLRYGMAADKDIITRADIKPLYDALVMPAHILAFNHRAAPAFLYGLGKPFVIDPMTFMYQSVKSYSDDWGTRKSARRLADRYGGAFAAMVAAGAEDAARAGAPALARPTQYGGFDTLNLVSQPGVVEALGKGCIEFQRTAVTKVVTERVGRYRTGVPATGPEWLLTPYFYFEAPTDPWYDACTRVQLAAQEAASGTECPLLPVVFTSAATLQELPHRQQLLKDYGPWPSNALVLWLDDFKQSQVTLAGIQALRAFVRELLDQHGKRTVFLYGGYLAMLLREYGAAGVSHGIFYAEHKGRQAMPPAEPPPDRYYFPLFHEFRMMTHAIWIMQQVGDAHALLCTCPVCGPILQGHPERLPLLWDGDLLKAHFLHSRKRERESLAEHPLADHIASLRATYGRYNDAVAGIENAEFKSQAFLPDLAYMRTWADALS